MFTESLKEPELGERIVDRRSQRDQGRGHATRENVELKKENGILESAMGLETVKGKVGARYDLHLCIENGE